MQKLVIQRMKVLPPCDCALIPSLTSGFHRAPVFFSAQSEHPLSISESHRTLLHLFQAA